MNRDVTAALRLALQGHPSLRQSRLEGFLVLVVGVLSSRPVNLSHLACLFPTGAEIASNYRRLQRFFEQVIVDGSQLARVIVRIAGVGSGPWLLALDRTCCYGWAMCQTLFTPSPVTSPGLVSLAQV